MPSGAKKRKAAKKKKEKEANINPSTNNLQGNDDLKSIDEKGSDGGEGSSPAHHDHDDHYHSFNEGSEEVEEGDPSAAQPSGSDVKSLEEVPSDSTSAEVAGGQEDSVVKIESDLKSGESSDRINDSIERVESAKKSCCGNGNSSGTSNVESLDESNLMDEHYNSKQEANKSEDLTNSVYSSSTKMTMTSENVQVEEIGNLVVEPYVNSVKAASSVLEVKSNDNGSVSLENSTVSQVAATDLAVKKNDDKVFPLSDHHVRTPDLEESKLKEYDSKVSATLSDSPLTESTKDAEHIKDLETLKCSGNQPHVVPAPHMVQKTPWLSCCGLFEVLSGSDR